MVGYIEEPGRWHQSPEYDLDKAIAWAKRNRGQLEYGPRPHASRDPAAERVRPQFYLAGNPCLSSMFFVDAR